MFTLEDENFLNKTIAENFQGSIMIIDKNCKVIYVRTARRDAQKGIDPSILINKDMHDLIKQGVYSSSPSLKAFHSKKVAFDFVMTQDQVSLLTVSCPVLDENGEILIVIAYALEVENLFEYARKAVEEKDKMIMQLNYINEQHNIPFITYNPILKQIISNIKKIAQTESTVVIYGESGTGKEVLSRFIHNNSMKKKSVFIPVNCAAIPSELLESEFFGYEKGSFTGANKEGKVGLFEYASDGTLYLDEISEMPLSLQAKLLRVIESREFMRIGGRDALKTDARIIASTNRNLIEMVKEKKFREDLYYRLNVITITIPPIRERREDIEPLAKAFLHEFNKKYNTSKFFSPEVIDYMKSYYWPGNAREIRNFVERLYITADSDMLIHTPFSRVDYFDQDDVYQNAAHAEIDPFVPYKEALRIYEEKYIRTILESCDGNVADAAKKLNISRASLYKKIAAFNEQE